MTDPQYKAMTRFLRDIGTESVPHTDTVFLAHMIGVYFTEQSVINLKCKRIILGCTEIPLAIKVTYHESIPLIDSTKVLARALLLETTPDAIKK